ncbi:UNVERIFIED_CONTAM: hypothetical protein PYX00_006912 [Menopon gallinae]|uniref:Uncharacterized protein n=1 Tax=Menopon gallinae TaxID=328185 RepID=A0AAW2HHA4_9NEOP
MEFVDATGWKKAKQLARSLRIIFADKECPSHLDESEQKEDFMAKLAKCSIKDVRVTSMVSTVKVMNIARVKCPLQENESILVRWGNVNRSRQSQDLRIATESGLGTSVIIVCEPCRNTRRKDANRFTDEDGDVTEIQNANIVDWPFRNAAAGKGYVIASDGRWHIAGCYIFRN